MYRWLLAFSSAALVATSALAQGAAGASNTGADATIDPGMTRAQVIEKLGKPATIRNYQGSTYLMYSNKCGKSCGMQDIVILDHDVVVDAVFRSPNRHYTGTSSSPEATKANSRTQRNQPLAVPAQSAGKAEVVAPSMSHAPADSAASSMSHPPADSAQTPTSRPPADSARSSMSRPPADSSMAPPPQNTTAPYGKAPTSAPPADSAATLTSHPPVDNSSSSTSHPPKPPK
jgi:outer membrane protein assembly factor BamE (lipoprotein component of BamABCDE complex)